MIHPLKELRTRIHSYKCHRYFKKHKNKKEVSQQDSATESLTNLRVEVLRLQYQSKTLRAIVTDLEREYDKSKIYNDVRRYMHLKAIVKHAILRYENLRQHRERLLKAERKRHMTKVQRFFHRMGPWAFYIYMHVIQRQRRSTAFNGIYSRTTYARTEGGYEENIAAPNSSPNNESSKEVSFDFIDAQDITAPENNIIDLTVRKSSFQQSTCNYSQMTNSSSTSVQSNNHDEITVLPSDNGALQNGEQRNGATSPFVVDMERLNLTRTIHDERRLVRLLLDAFSELSMLFEQSKDEDPIVRFKSLKRMIVKIISRYDLRNEDMQEMIQSPIMGAVARNSKQQQPPPRPPAPNIGPCKKPPRKSIANISSTPQLSSKHKNSSYSNNGSLTLSVTPLIQRRQDRRRTLDNITPLNSTSQSSITGYIPLTPRIIRSNNDMRPAITSTGITSRMIQYWSNVKGTFVPPTD